MHGTCPASGLVRESGVGIPHPSDARVYHRPDALQRFVHRAIVGGGVRQGPHRHVWNIAGDCVSPIWLEHSSKGEVIGFAPEVFIPWDDELEAPFDPIRETVPYRAVNPHVLYTAVPCRKCERCLKRRGRLWRNRCQDEIRVGVRSWFVTLTMNASTRWRFKALAMARLLEGGTRWADLSPRERFEEVNREMQRAFTKYVKRLRAPRTVVRRGEKVRLPGSRIRYFSVTEAHKDGTPHLHVVFHELRGGTLTKEQLQAEWGGKPWRLGFAKPVLIDETRAFNGACYLTKYLSKEMIGRPRASLKYGRPLEAAALRNGWVEKPRRSQPEAMAPVENEANDCWMTTDPEAMAELTRALRMPVSATPGADEGAELASSAEPMERESAKSCVTVAECFETERIRHYRRREAAWPPGRAVRLLN